MFKQRKISGIKYFCDWFHPQDQSEKVSQIFDLIFLRSAEIEMKNTEDWVCTKDGRWNHQEQKTNHP